jgi:hypothetical protein
VFLPQHKKRMIAAKKAQLMLPQYSIIACIQG